MTRPFSDKEKKLLDEAGGYLSWATWRDVTLWSVKGLPDVPRTKKDDKLREDIIKRINHGDVDDALLKAKEKLDRLVELRKGR